jgi:hypothetical protein
VGSADLIVRLHLMHFFVRSKHRWPGHNVGSAQHIALSRLARRHQLAKATTSQRTRAKKRCQLPTPVSQRTATAPFLRIPAAPFASFVLHNRGGSRKHAEEVRCTSLRRMNTLPSPSTTELTCAPCLTLHTCGWVRSAKHMSAREAFVQHPIKLSFMLL